MPLYLIRHTRVAVPAGLCYGHLDVPLAETFTEEAQQVRARLPAVLPPLWSSPSQRCRRLAEALAHSVRLDERLRELSFGDWEGRTWTELDSPQARHWGDHWQTARPPGGETLEELMERVDTFLQELPAGDQVIVTHAGPIRIMLHRLAGVPLDAVFQRPIGYGEVIQVSRPAEI